MKAVTYRGAGGLEVVSVAEVADPVCQSGEALIEIAYAGLNRADILERKGAYGPIARKGPETIPGLEFSGIVRALGDGVTSLALGDRVAGLVTAGAHAEFIAAEAGLLAKLPDTISLRDAAALPEAYITAADALEQARFRAGDSVLVHAVGSGVGLAAIALARAGGAFVAGTSRTAEKLERAREYGLDAAFELDEGWTGRALAATNGRGFDIVLDFVGGALLARNVGVLATGGRIVQIGTLGGSLAANFQLGALMLKRGTLIGTMLRPRPLHEKIALVREFERRARALHERGGLRATIDSVYSLDRVTEAHERMENDRNFGKIVLQAKGDNQS